MNAPGPWRCAHAKARPPDLLSSAALPPARPLRYSARFGNEIDPPAIGKRDVSRKDVSVATLDDKSGADRQIIREAARFGHGALAGWERGIGRMRPGVIGFPNHLAVAA